MRTLVGILRRATSRRLAQLLFPAALSLLCAAPAQALVISPPYLIDITQTVAFDLTALKSLAPTDPCFTGSTCFTGGAGFSIGNFFTINEVPTFLGTPFGSTDCSFSSGLAPVDPCNVAFTGVSLSADLTMVWALGGTIGNFTTVAWPPGPIVPATAPSTAPLITIAQFLQPGFAPFAITGSIYAWDAPVQVGTFDIQVSMSTVPEPATLALLGLGLTGLAAARRRKQ